MNFCLAPVGNSLHGRLLMTPKKPRRVDPTRSFFYLWILKNYQYKQKQTFCISISCPVWSRWVSAGLPIFRASDQSYNSNNAKDFFHRASVLVVHTSQWWHRVMSTRVHPQNPRVGIAFHQGIYTAGRFAALMKKIMLTLRGICLEDTARRISSIRSSCCWPAPWRLRGPTESAPRRAGGTRFSTCSPARSGRNISTAVRQE